MTAITQDTFTTKEKSTLQVMRETLIAKRWYVHVMLWAAVLFMGFPVYYAMLSSTQTNAQIFTYQLTPGTAFADNLNIVLEQNIGRLMFNTFIIAALITFGKAVLSIFSGMALVYFRFPGKYIIFGFILAGLMVPGEVTIIALFRLVAVELGWGNTWTALVIPAVARAHLVEVDNLDESDRGDRGFGSTGR